MAVRSVIKILVALLLAVTASVGFAANPPRMRPYTGVGVIVFSNMTGVPSQEQQLQMYEEPGLSRIGKLDSSRISGNEWIFGVSSGSVPLVVSARKGDWLRIYYDDAGREAWINPQNAGRFQSWEQFLKVQPGRMLPGLRSQYYQLQQQPNGKLLATMTPKQVFKIVKVDGGWGMVLTEQSQLGWLRWYDDDGRLTVGF
jgi:SH3-like domain-containing protein